MKPTPWFKRTFPIITDKGQLPALIERLAGTPIRLEEKVLSFTDEFLVACTDDDWSIQEHAGHLLNLEGLWLTRLSDLLSSSAELSEADLMNYATYEAKYNEQAIEAILETFAEVRLQLVTLLRSISTEDLSKKSLHPRLKTPMTILDLVFFIAEHDDHHLAMIHWLSQK